MTIKTAKRIHLSRGGVGILVLHLCEQLLQRGDEVLCIANFISSTRENVAHLLDNHRMEMPRHNVTFTRYAEDDEIFDIGCPAAQVNYQFDSFQTTKPT